MKTIRQALIDEIIYPIPEGLVENKLIARGLTGEEEFTLESAKSSEYRGCFADCLVALVQAVNFSESDKSVGTLTDEVKKKLLNRANSIYEALGEDLVPEVEPKVYINC
jgi:hypothetical protein